uniref:SMP-LTD domain-containing protein n=1 Tax=Caenorhabditis tropicalis TaxID=1561998 RepID=A0A1I7TVA9_9PELO
MNDVIGADVWDFFCKKLPRNDLLSEEQAKAYSEIEWVAQTDELKAKLVRSTVTRYDKEEVAIRIPLMTQIFEVIIRRSEHFPESSPVLSGDFINGFALFEWNMKSALFDLCETVTDYCITIDIAILEIKEAELDGFHLMDLEIDGEENGHLLVRMRATKYKETLTLSLDTEDFKSFPRVLRCSNPCRMSSFDCERWNSEDKLGSNLRRLYGEIDEHDISVKNTDNDMNFNAEDNNEFMDFI